MFVAMIRKKRSDLSASLGTVDGSTGPAGMKQALFTVTMIVLVIVQARAMIFIEIISIDGTHTYSKRYDTSERPTNKVTA